MEAIKGTKSKRRVIAESILHELTALMFAADPGSGKSTLSTQVAVELSSGVPVFGYYEVPSPQKILYIQAERNIMELLERLEVINETIPINTENLVVTDEYQKLNLLNPGHARLFVEAVKRDCPDVDVVFIDPIYATVLGGLKEDKQASTFTKVMSIVQKELGCSLWYNHHTTKSQYTHKGEEIEKADPFYGSQWLKAHITGSFHIKRSKDGVLLRCKKDNYSLLAEEIPLEYNPETEMCHVLLEKMPAERRMEIFLNARRKDGQEFTFKDIKAQTGLCTRGVRNLTMHSSFQQSVIVVSHYKNRYIYKMKGVK